jgi:hypothetical protein
VQQGWAASVSSIIAQAPDSPHTQQGLDTCLLCHDPAGKSIPAPADHHIYIEEQCLLCHQVMQ